MKIIEVTNDAEKDLRKTIAYLRRELSEYLEYTSRDAIKEDIATALNATGNIAAHYECYKEKI